VHVRILHDPALEQQWRRASTRRGDGAPTPPSPVERVEHLDDNKRRQRHRRRLIVREYFAVDGAKALVLHQTLRLMRLSKHKHRNMPLQSRIIIALIKRKIYIRGVMMFL